LVGSGAFETLAQFAIAQAGFASVVVVLRRKEDQFHPADGFRVFNALVPSIVAGFLALFPIGLHLIGVDEGRTWLAASLLFASVTVFLCLQILLRMKRLPPEARVIISNRVAIANSVTLGLAIVACLVNSTTTLLGPPHGGFYFFGVLALLVMGAVAFVRLVFIRPPA
jgi:hypothetical protein